MGGNLAPLGELPGNSGINPDYLAVGYGARAFTAFHLKPIA
jgi:hypothetical protein